MRRAPKIVLLDRRHLDLRKSAEVHLDNIGPRTGKFHITLADINISIRQIHEADFIGYIHGDVCYALKSRIHPCHLKK